MRVLNHLQFPRRLDLILFAVVALGTVSCQRLPYTFLLSTRSWVIGDEEGVGTKVAGIRPGGLPTGGPITYVFEKGASGDVDLSEYFGVDKLGNVVIKKELKGLAGASSSLYVGAEGEEIISFKTEVHVQIVPQAELHLHSNQQGIFPPPRPPYFQTTATPTTTSTVAAAVSNATATASSTKVTSTAVPATSSFSTSTSPSSTTTLQTTTTTTPPPSIAPPPPEESSSDSAWIWLTSLSLLVILIILTLFVLRQRRRRKALLRTTHPVVKKAATSGGILGQWAGKRAHSNRYEDSSEVPPPPPPYSVAPTAAVAASLLLDKWELPRGSLKIVGMLGEGCFGQVWRCEFQQTTSSAAAQTVAVKTLKDSAGERERSDLLSELSVMKTLDPHPNVVKLLGCCTEKDPIFVVMEYVAMGKLQTFLRESRDAHYYRNLHSDSNSLSSRDLTNFAYQCARGMEFLASKGIIHRDLAARNILVDVDRTCKVADFGFARDLVDNHVYERKSDGRQPIRWMAPEALFDNLFTTKTDVWSFGVLMWEIVTLGSTPYPGMGASEVMKRVREGFRLEKPSHCRRELYNVMFYCWAALPADRPTFSELTKFLSALLGNETDYIQLELFPDHAYYNFNVNEDLGVNEEHTQIQDERV